MVGAGTRLLSYFKRTQKFSIAWSKKVVFEVLYIGFLLKTVKFVNEYKNLLKVISKAVGETADS